MQDTDLFMELAGIAGVFVGFGALIAVRSGGASGREEIGYMRGVVSMGALTIIAALAPVTLDRYRLPEHEVWALSSGLFLVALFVMIATMARTPEYRANWAADIEQARMARRSRWVVAVEGTIYVLYVLASLLVPVLIVLSLAPELEAALYFTVVVLSLAGAGWTLLSLVFLQRDLSVAVPAAGDTSA